MFVHKYIILLPLRIFITLTTDSIFVCLSITVKYVSFILQKTNGNVGVNTINSHFRYVLKIPKIDPINFCYQKISKLYSQKCHLNIIPTAKVV